MIPRWAMIKRIPRWLVLASFVAALTEVWLALPLMPGKYFERVSVARTLASRGEFADPFTSLPTGPTAHVSPIYPLFLAAVFRSLGDTPASAILLTLLCLLVHCLYPLLLFSFAAQQLSNDVTALAISVIAIVAPHFPPMLSVETIYLVNMLLLSFMLTWRWLTISPSSSRHAVREGILWALCVLLNGAAIAVWLPWIVFLYWRKGVRGRRLLISGAVLVTAFLTAVSPWTLRNAYVFGKPILLRGNLGFELALSNRDGAAGSTLENARRGILDTFHPNFNKDEAQILRNDGEVEYNRRKWIEARQWIVRNPARFISLTMERIRLFWFPPLGDAPSPYIISLWILTVLAGAGVIKLWQDNNPFVFLALAVYTVYPALLYFIQSSVVYTLPIVWLHVMCAGYLIASIPIVRRCLAGMPEQF